MATTALTGRQKAAMLLMTLDATTAAELLKGADPKVVEALAVELSYMEAAGLSNPQQTDAVTMEFFNAISQDSSKQSGSDLQSFVQEMLKNTVGQERAKQFQTGLGALLRRRDPLLPIRKADQGLLASILEKEHPQAVAVILAELEPKRCAALLSRLSEGVRISAVSRMTGVENVSPEARHRIGEMIAGKIEQAITAKTVGMVPQAGAATPAAAMPEEGQGPSSLRKVAVVVRTLDREVRDNIMSAIGKKDKAAAEAINSLMILWEDVSLIGDRSMQEGLRGLDERTLAMALYEAEEKVVHKVKSNISERAAVVIDEEASLMQKPKKKEVEEAQEKVLRRLRELQVNGDLTFEEETS
jgi:flagellar motor switch protein FliG